MIIEEITSLARLVGYTLILKESKNSNKSARIWLMYRFKGQYFSFEKHFADSMISVLYITAGKYHPECIGT